MKTPYILLAIGAVIIVSGFVLLQADKPSELVSDMVQESGSSNGSSEQDVVMKDDQATGNYLPYSQENLEASKDSRRVLFFFANWCPTCKPVDAELTAQEASLPDDIVVLRVNYNDSDTDDSEKELAKDYTVTYQHTFVQIDAAGQEVARWTGGGLSELLDNVK